MERTRGAVVIIEGNEVAIMKRVRQGHTYYLFPGGGVEQGETVEQTAIREAYEELGVHVKLDKLAALIEFNGNQQYYYFATITGGVFGSGTGPEYSYSPESERGSYTPIWLDISKLDNLDVRPREVVQRISNGNYRID